MDFLEKLAATLLVFHIFYIVGDICFEIGKQVSPLQQHFWNFLSIVFDLIAVLSSISLFATIVALIWR